MLRSVRIPSAVQSLLQKMMPASMAERGERRRSAEVAAPLGIAETVIEKEVRHLIRR